jgi:hypothetical protein
MYRFHYIPYLLDVMAEGPLKLPSLKVATDKPNPTQGVGTVAWSPDSAFLATRNGILVRILS